jgi:hypothetical protein
MTRFYELNSITLDPIFCECNYFLPQCSHKNLNVYYPACESLACRLNFFGEFHENDKLLWKRCWRNNRRWMDQGLGYVATAITFRKIIREAKHK